MRIKPFAGLLVVLLGVSAAYHCIAGDQQTGLSGAYTYSTVAKAPGGKPTCEERWTFAADGVETIESGAEIARTHYRVEVVDGDHWLVEDWGGTNGLADCRGRRSTAHLQERRLYFYFNAAGGFVLCASPTQYLGKKVVSGCYGIASRQR